MSLIVKIGADIRSFDREMRKLTSDITGVTSKLQSQGTMMSQAVTLPLAGVGIAAAKTGMDFEAAMSQVKAASGASGKDMQSLESMARELGKTTKYSGTEAALGMTELLKAGQSTEQAMASIPGVLSLASAGELEVAEAAAIATTSLAQFGLGADQAGHVGDVMAKTANTSKTSVSELSAALSNVGTIAKANGMSFETTNGILGIFANKGIEGANAGDKLRMIIAALGTPSKAAGKQLDSLGVSVYDSDGKMRGMTDIIGDLSTGMQGMSQESRNNALSTIFGADAIGAANILLGEGKAGIEKYSESLKDSKGYADEFAKTLNDNVKGKLEAMKGDLEEVGITIFQALTPAIEALISAVSGLANWFSELSPNTQAFIMALAGLVAAVGPLLVIIATLVNAIGTIKAALMAVKIASLGAVGIWLIVGIAIAALVLLIITHWDTIKATTIAVWDAIKEFMSGLWQSITETATSIFSAIGTFFSDLWTGIKESTMTIWNAIKDFFAEWGLTILAVIMGPIGLLALAIYENWDAIKAATEIVWNAIKDFLSGLWAGIVAVFGPIFSAMGSVISAVWNGISTVTSAVWNFISQYLVALWNALLYFVTPVFSAIASFLKGVWDGIKSVVTKVWNAIKTFLTTLWNGISSAATTVWNAISSFFTKWLNNISKTFIKIWSTIKTSLTTAWNAIKTAASTVWNAIQGVIEKPVNAVKTKVTATFDSLKSGVSKIFGAIKTVASTIWDSISSTVTGTVTNLVDKVKGAFGGMKDTVVSVWEGMKSGIKTVINGIIGMVNSFIGGFNKPAKALNKIPGVSAPTIGKIPMLATGGTIFGNGQAIVGEAGPELVSKSGSSVKVTPLSAGEKSGGIGGALGGGNGGVIEVPVVIDGRTVARVVAPYMDNELRGRRDSTNRAKGGW